MATSEISARLPTRFGRVFAVYSRRRFAILFYSLLLTIAVEPLVGAFLFHRSLTAILLAVNVVVAILSALSGYVRRVLLVAVVGTMAIRSLVTLVVGDDYDLAQLALWTVIALIAAGGAVRHAMGAATVKSEHLYAALSAYLLAGLFFGVFHYLIERNMPGSYAVGGQIVPDGIPIEDAIYFSFVTLATLGYGEILPLSAAARGLAVVEAIASQLYLAVMIARLVGLYASPRDRGDAPESATSD